MARSAQLVNHPLWELALLQRGFFIGGDMDKAVLESRFWDKVVIKDSTECWIWTGTKLKRGYGFVRRNGKLRYTHVHCYFLTTGYMPHVGEYICHTCNNPSCVNPSHLYLGNARTNSDDRERRYKSGELIDKRGKRKHE